MFGNIKGWAISALIAVLIGLLINFEGKPPRITPPTGTIPLALEPATLPVDPASLEIKPAGASTDAHELYVKMIEDYKKNQFKYEKYSDPRKLAADKPEFLQWIADAADADEKAAVLFKRKPELVINYDSPDSIEALHAEGLLAGRLGLYLLDPTIKEKTGSDEADKYLKGAFILGQRMYNERLRFEESTAGIELMKSAAYAMRKEADSRHDVARVAKIDAFLTAAGDYDHKLVPVMTAIGGIGIEGQELNNAGDVFDVAQNSKETMWRVEAALKLGRMRYMKNVTLTDQRGALRVLKELADNADALPVRTAAAAGRDLKVEDFRKFGG